MSLVTAKLQNSTSAGVSSNKSLPIIVIGNGPVGIRTIQELVKRLPNTPIIIYGDEQHEPYNRVKLSSWLAGEVDWESLLQPLPVSNSANIEQRFGYRITKLNTAQKFVVDNSDKKQYFSKLVLATGSYPYTPNIPGIHLPGVGARGASCWQHKPQPVISKKAR